MPRNRKLEAHEKNPYQAAAFKQKTYYTKTKQLERGVFEMTEYQKKEMERRKKLAAELNRIDKIEDLKETVLMNLKEALESDDDKIRMDATNNALKYLFATKKQVDVNHRDLTLEDLVRNKSQIFIEDAKIVEPKQLEE